MDSSIRVTSTTYRASLAAFAPEPRRTYVSVGTGVLTSHDPTHRPERPPLMTKALAALRARLSEEEGATVVEYGLMIGLVAIVLVGAAILLRDPLIDLFFSTRPTG